MPKLILLIAALAALTGCQDADTIKRSLNGHGYSSVDLTGYTLKKCGLAIGFRAITQDLQPISGHVCTELRTRVISLTIDKES